MADKSVKTFGKRMANRAFTLETNVNVAKQKVASAINESVVPATPVLTGAARGGWVAGSSSGSSNTGEDKGGSYTVAINNARINRLSKSADRIYIVNNVGHIGLLNRGHSKKQAGRFVERAVNTGRRVLAGLGSIWAK